jgi:hypothetical protein
MMAAPDNIHRLNMGLGLGVQLERDVECSRSALARVVVGRGADAAAAKHGVAAGEGIAQRGGDEPAVVAHVAGPGQRQAARAEQLDDFGQVLVLPLAGEDFIADDDQTEVHGRAVLG